MSLLRVIALGTVVAASTGLTCFVSADRLAHPAGPAAGGEAPGLRSAPARATTEDPATVTQGPENPEPVPVRMLSGFDTERLNALMRGDPPPAGPQRKR